MTRVPPPDSPPSRNRRARHWLFELIEREVAAQNIVGRGARREGQTQTQCQRRPNPEPSYSAQEKAQAVLAVWTDPARPAEVCRQMVITWPTFSQWQSRAMEGMLQALERYDPLRSGWSHDLNSVAVLGTDGQMPEPKFEWIHSRRRCQFVHERLARERVGGRRQRADRLRAVLVAAAEKFGWKDAWKKYDSAQKTGVGLACGTEKGSFVATCARIEVDEKGTFKVFDACTAFECGAIQNPANLKAQVAGCVIMGLGGALREEMRFKDGQILNPKFSKYEVPRFKDMPKLETVLVNRPDLPSVGAGETPIIGIAPAVANALFNATQTRIRSQPIRNGVFRSA